MSSHPPNEPERIPPFFQTSAPNEPIALIKEPEEVRHPNDNMLYAIGTIEMFQFWSPMRFRFRFVGTIQCSEDDLEDMSHRLRWEHFGDVIEIKGSGFSVTGIVDGADNDGLVGELDCDELVIGTDHKLDRVIFHIANYPCPGGGQLIQDRDGDDDIGQVSDLNEIRLDAKGWRIRLQPVRQVEELDWAADEKYGMVLSGIGEIRKNELQQFKPKDAIGILEALRYFLSFAFHEWTPPLLAVGSNSVKEKSWRYWRNYSLRRVPFRSQRVFVPFSGGDALSNAFSRFHSKWDDESWREPLEMSVTWLVETTKHDDQPERAIAMAQIPLEMLAWMVFVDKHTIVDEAEFEKLSAASKLQLLLSHCQIDFQVPKSLRALREVASKTKHHTGPQILTKVRNTIIHPKKRNRLELKEWASKFGTSIRLIHGECQKLYEHYIMLVLLFLIGYSGRFADRLEDLGFIGRPTPWSSDQEGPDES